MYIYQMLSSSASKSQINKDCDKDRFYLDLVDICNSSSFKPCSPFSPIFEPPSLPLCLPSPPNFSDSPSLLASNPLSFIFSLEELGE